MRKGLITVFLSLCMAALFFPNAALADFEETELGGAAVPLAARVITPSQPKGDGSQANPYQIKTEAELYWFAGLVNGTLAGEGMEQNPSAWATLINDITINGDMDPNLFAMSGDGALSYDGGAVPDSFAKWTPIGSSEASAYQGTFDGQGYTIRGLYQYETSTEDTAAGLFGWNGEDGVIQDVALEDCYLGVKVDGNSVAAYVGGVCGYNAGDLENCTSSGQVSTDASFYSFAGGVCGWNLDGTITGCDSSGPVMATATGDDTYACAGGICGYGSGGSITKCTNSGQVSTDASFYSFAGGVCGWNLDGTITGCGSSGQVAATATGDDTNACAGGVCGCNWDGIITGCASSGVQVSAQTSEISAFAGGTCGYNINEDGGGIITSCTSSYEQLLATATGDSEVYAYAGGACGYNNRGTVANCSSIGPVTANASFFALAGGTCGLNDNGSLENCDSSAGLVTAATEGVEARTYAGGACGSNVGGSIIGSSSSPVSAAATDGYIIAGGTCGYNSGSLENCSSTEPVSADGAGELYGGGVCGYNINEGSGGTIINCTSSSPVTVTVTGDGEIYAHAGGACGANYGTITNCGSSGPASVDGSGELYAGGVCGYNAGEYGGTITSCSSSPVSADGPDERYTGGVCGWSDGTITNCYFLESAGIAGVGNQENPGAAAKTKEDYQSGQVAWLLNDGQKPCRWVQELGREAFPRPVMEDGDEKDGVVQVTVIFPTSSQEKVYGNQNQALLAYPIHYGGTVYAFFENSRYTIPIDIRTRIYSGDTTIYAREGVAVEALTLSPSRLQLYVGKRAALTAAALPSNASYGACFDWSSNNEAVATVDQNGTVTARAAGTAVITAQAMDGSGQKDTCTVTVTTPVYGIAPDTTPLDFGSVTVGYSAPPAAKTVTITNVGQWPVTLTQPSGTASFTVGTLSAAELAVGGRATITVQPKAGLAVGEYSEQLQISGTYDVRADVDLRFVVTRQSSGGSGGGGGGGSSSSGNKTETVTNPDGSSTTTVTKPDGSTTETTKHPDGSQQVVNTNKDGTVTTTTTDKDGNKTETVAKPDGSSTTTVTRRDGSSGTTTVSSSGKTEAVVKVPASVVDSAAEKGEAVTLPMPAVPNTADRENAPTVTVDLPSGTTAKVEIPVAEVTTGTVAVLVKSDGTEEIIKGSLPTENGVAVTLSAGDTVKIVDNAKTFSDVSDSYWGKDYIDFVVSRDLFSGTSGTTFSPDTAMTRGMIVTVLAAYAGADTSSAGGAWYEAGRQWAMENGVSDGTYMENALTREQLATMLWQFAKRLGCDTTQGGMAIREYVDFDQISDYAVEAMTWAVNAGLISGTTTTTLSPQAQATRAQVATILMRFCQLDQ